MAVILIILGVSGRLLPHAYNFTPLISIALFAGVYLNKKQALIVLFSSLLISDFFLGFYDWKLLTAVYGSYFLIGLISLVIKNNKNTEMIFAGSIVAAFVFFLVTNLAVWQFSSWYAHNLAGLSECFILALPFFRNTLLGSIFYAAVLFGSYELAIFLAEKKSLALKKNSL